MTDSRPPAWTLRPSHPDLCPGVGEPCLYDACYRSTVCRVCGCQTGAESAPSVPGGGRVGQHYPRSSELAGQLDLFAPQEATQ